MKKLLIIIPLAILMLVPSELNARTDENLAKINLSKSSTKTYGDLLDELAALKQEKKDKENEKQLTEKEYQETKSNINTIDAKIQETERKIQDTIKKIEDLGVKINDKKTETNNILVFLQLSSGEKSYLEYIFKAKSFTDFIHRVSIVEQLSKYNKEQINEMNNLIEENNRLQKELETTKAEQESERTKLKTQLNKLGSRIDEMQDIGMTLDEKISSKQEEITLYKNRGCKNRRDILKICGKVASIPYDTGFIRPVKGDIVVSRFGNRKSPITGLEEGHSGIDIAVYGSVEGQPIYAAADGVVANKYKVGCGGQILTIHHNIKGVAYTTFYMHLLKFGEFDVGDLVTKNDIIGYMGGGYTTAIKLGNPKAYDRCTTGTHAHFTIAKGHIQLANYRAYIVDPEIYVYFPYKFAGRTW